jgi:hypothetical protein
LAAQIFSIPPKTEKNQKKQHKLLSPHSLRSFAAKILLELRGRKGFLPSWRLGVLAMTMFLSMESPDSESGWFHSLLQRGRCGRFRGYYGVGIMRKWLMMRALQKSEKSAFFS